MPALIDLSKPPHGPRFGKWTVYRRAVSRGRNTQWDCVCECGRREIVLAHSLTSGKSTQCRSCASEGAEVGRKPAFAVGDTHIGYEIVAVRKIETQLIYDCRCIACGALSSHRGSRLAKKRRGCRCRTTS